MDLSPSDNEATTNQASTSKATDKQHPKNAAPGRKSKAKKGKSGPSKAKDTIIPPSWPERNILETAEGGLSVMVPISHDLSGVEPASGNIRLTTVEPNQMPTTTGAQPSLSSVVGLNPLAQLHRALLQLAESHPAIFSITPC